MVTPFLRPREVEYPESDGKPMAETDFHGILMMDLVAVLRRRYRDDPTVYIASNNFLYYEEGNPAAVVSPDVYVVRGVRAGPRRTYKLWVEGKAPELVIELTSRSTHLEDLGNKRAVYEALGVKEYFIFDPEGDRFDPPFRMFRQQDRMLVAASPRQEPDGTLVFASEVVGLELHGRGAELRWVDPATGAALPTPLELAQEVDAQARRADDAARKADDAVRKADAERLKADAERRNAQAERERAEAVEAELTRLREELRRRGRE